MTRARRRSRGARAAARKQLLLGYLPAERSAWASTVRSKRALYVEWKAELIVDPSKGAAEPSDARDASLLVTADAHPLTSAPHSPWAAFFENEELLREIEKDVSRTLPDYGFYAAENAAAAAHRAAIRQILFVYAKLNPGIRYVQGMNEIVAPIFFLLAGEAADGGRAGEPTEQRLADAEADAFFCFTNLMAETRDAFCQPLDGSDVGVKSTIGALAALLAVADPALHAHLAALGVSPQFYSFRWLTLLCSQEFDLPDVLRIWDSFFADERRFRFVLFWCLAMLTHVRERLLDADFATAVKTLQRYPDPDIVALHARAARLYAADRAGALADAGARFGAVEQRGSALPQPVIEGLGQGLAAAAAVVRKAGDALAGAAGGSAAAVR